MATHSEMMENLEAMIDEFGLTDVLATLTLITSEKADHIRHTWQDKVTAKPWDRVSRSIDTVARKAQELNL